MQAGERDATGNAQTPGQACANPTRCDLGLFRILDYSLSAVVKVLPGFGCVRPWLERISSRTPRRASNWATVLETAGCPRFTARAAPENEPLSTTRTKVCIAANRSMAIPSRNARSMGWGQLAAHSMANRLQPQAGPKLPDGERLRISEVRGATIMGNNLACQLIADHLARIRAVLRRQEAGRAASSSYHKRGGST